jgi:hypothetical protein
MTPVIVLATGKNAVYIKETNEEKCVQGEIQRKTQRIKHT